MKRIRMLVVASLVVSAGVCAGTSANESQTLFDPATYKPLVAEVKAYRPGDVLTVVVQESATATTAADSRAQRNTGVSAQVGSNKVGPHSVAANATSESDGGGRTQRSGRLLATLSVRVVEVMSNGDLVVQGQQRLVINGEEQSIALSGIVRPRDIGENNTVLSTRIADARISFDGEGFIADKSKPNWLTRLLSLIGF
jgi:flagellar L-ring protein FlgH